MGVKQIGNSRVFQKDLTNLEIGIMNVRSTILFVMIVFASSFVFAQAPDTVLVEPGLGTLNDAVANPENQGKVFKLRSGPMSVYVLTDQINNLGWHLQVVGEESDDIPPLIFRDTQSNKVPLFVAEGDITLRNLFIVYHNPAGEKIRKEVVKVTVDSVDVVVDNIICTGGRGWFVSLENSNMVNLSVTNCIVSDGYKPDAWYREGVFVWLQGELTGNYYIANNTVFNMDNRTLMNRRGNPPTPIDNLVVEHNTFYLITKEVFERMYYKSIEVKNNLFIDCWAAGVAQPGNYKGVDYAGDFIEPFDPDFPGNEAGAFFDVDTLPPEWGIDESERDIKFHHNLRHDTQKMIDWRAEVNALYVPFLSASGENIFEAYDNFIWQNNITDVPIEFTQPLSESLYDKVIAWADAVRMAAPPVMREWDPDGDEDSFTNPWPLPIDFSYDYEKVFAERGYHIAGDDGYPLGDLNWFPELKKDWEAGEPGPLTPITTAVEKQNAAVVDEFELQQNYPNPFNPTTTIEYSMNITNDVTLSVYNMLGQKIKTLVNSQVKAGNHSVTWNGTDEQGHSVGSGIYYARIATSDETKTIKMVLIR